MTLAKWFIHLHDALHWWVPGVLALYTAIVPWVMSYPSRNYEEVNYNPHSLNSDSEVVNIHVQIFFVALVIYYSLWFALPHEGTEILLLILAVPWAGLYLLITVFNWFMESFFTFSDSHRDEWVKKGLSYAEWEIFKYKKETRELDQSLREMEEREAMFRGEDIRKDRFRVFDGRRDRT